jgi:histone acetyltransferase (RNA polymerase elongator complex component)
LISGANGNLPAAEEIVRKIDTWCSTADGRPLEVAFFGGSFTALPQNRQAELLAPLQMLLKAGVVRSVRISTRPDCLDDGRVEYLAGMGVRTIELGVQSMNDAVLAASGRGHTASQSEAAIRCIKKSGLAVGAQLMPGLPADTPAHSLDSLDRVISAGVDFVRIYPTVVLRGTELARRYADGDFVPMTFERGVSLCKLLLHRAMLAGIDVIRIGLQADEGLNDESVLAGCWHPSLGQIVRSGLYGDLLCQMFAALPESLPVTVTCHPRRVSDVIGLGRSNLNRLQLCGREVDVVSDYGLAEEELRVDIFKGNIITDLHYSIHEV